MNVEMKNLNAKINMVITFEIGNESRNENFLRRNEPGDDI